MWHNLMLWLFWSDHSVCLNTSTGTTNHFKKLLAKWTWNNQWYFSWIYGFLHKTLLGIPRSHVNMTKLPESGYDRFSTCVSDNMKFLFSCDLVIENTPEWHLVEVHTVQNDKKKKLQFFFFFLPEGKVSLSRQAWQIIDQDDCSWTDVDICTLSYMQQLT